MNRVLLYLASALMILSVVVPPWRQTIKLMDQVMVQYLGYAPLWMPPQAPSNWTVTIDWLWLGCQVLFILLGWGLGWLVSTQLKASSPEEA